MSPYPHCARRRRRGTDQARAVIDRVVGAVAEVTTVTADAHSGGGSERNKLHLHKHMHIPASLNCRSNNEWKNQVKSAPKLEQFVTETAVYRRT